MVHYKMTKLILTEQFNKLNLKAKIFSGKKNEENTVTLLAWDAYRFIFV